MKKQFLLWFCIRNLRRFSIAQLVQATALKEGTCKQYVYGLQRAGYLERSSERPPLYSLSRDTGPAAPVLSRPEGICDPNLPQAVRSVRQRIWNVLRIWRRCTYGDLLRGAGCSKSSCAHYFPALHRAGYIDRVGVSNSSGRYGGMVFVLTKDTGIMAPEVEPDGSIFDPNTFDLSKLKEQ